MPKVRKDNLPRDMIWAETVDGTQGDIEEMINAWGWCSRLRAVVPLEYDGHLVSRAVLYFEVSWELYHQLREESKQDEGNPNKLTTVVDYLHEIAAQKATIEDLTNKVYSLEQELAVRERFGKKADPNQGALDV